MSEVSKKLYLYFAISKVFGYLVITLTSYREAFAPKTGKMPKAQYKENHVPTKQTCIIDPPFYCQV